LISRQSEVRAAITRGDFEEWRRVALRMRADDVGSGRAVMTCGGVALSVLLHALMISPLLFGGSQLEHKSTLEEGGLTSGVPAMTLVMLSEQADDLPEVDWQRPGKVLAAPSDSRTLMPVGSLHLAAALAPPSIDRAEQTSPENEPTTNDGERALMFGRYLGQVTARIERAWVRPRSAIGSSPFRCLVRVIQDRGRVVKEITLERCNGTTSWQLSLVRAIESASPFPAPPDASVFSSVLKFEMTAQQFVQGSSSDGYEPVLPQTLTTMPR